MAENESKTVHTTEKELSAIIDNLIQTQAVIALAYSVAEEHAAGERPWCYIENGLKLAHDRIEGAILRIQDMRDSQTEKGV